MNILENMVMNDCNEIGDYDAFTILLDLVIESESREIIEKILK